MQAIGSLLHVRSTVTDFYLFSHIAADFIYCTVCYSTVFPGCKILDFFLVVVLFSSFSLEGEKMHKA